VTLGELATRLGCGLEGDGRIEITRVAGLEDAGPGEDDGRAGTDAVRRHAPALRPSRAEADHGVVGESALFIVSLHDVDLVATGLVDA